VQRLQGLGVKIGDGATVAWQRLASPTALLQQLQTAVASKVGKLRA
jgi:trehalose 6-phosphate phosphatase